MEEAPKLIFKKRRRLSSSSSHPFVGIFTRSKSQIYLHCNRSGRARSDSFRLSKHHTNLRSSPVGFLSKTQYQSVNKKSRRKVRDLTQPSTDTDDWSCILIKDLRTRRVFSRASSIGGECGLCIDDKERDGSEKGSERIEDGVICDAGNLEGVDRNCLDGMKREENGDCMKSKMGYSCKEQNMKDVSSNLSVSDKNERRSDGDGEISNENGNLDEECVQATPPDAEIFGCRYENGDNQVEFLSPKPWIGGGQKKEAFQDSFDKKNSNYSGTKSVLNPWSRVKVFKAPGSLSYRRLLPYLMDMAKDKSCAPRKCKFPNIEDQQIVVTKSNTDSCSIDGQADNSGTLSQVAPIFANGSPVGSNSNLTSVEHVTDSSMLHGSQKDPCMQGYPRNSLVNECCSELLVNDKGHEKIEIETSWKEKDLNCSNPDSSSSMDDSHINECSSDTKPMDIEKTKRRDGGIPCNAQDANEPRHKLSLIVQKCPLGEVDEVGQHSDGALQTKTGVMKAFDTGDPCKAINPNHVSLNLVDAEVNGRTSNAEKKGNGNGDVLDKIDDPDESIQSTPPDADIFGKPEAYENMDSRIKSGLQVADGVLDKPLDVNIYRNICVGEKKVDSISRRKLGLNPCSRLKLLKTSSSFSCRRLLPYLTDIIKDNSGSLGNGNCSKIQMSSEENPFSPILSSDLYETPAEIFNGKSDHMKHDTEDSRTLQMAILSATNHASSINQWNLTSPENNETPTASGSQGEQKLQVAGVMSDKDRRLENAPDTVHSVHEIGSPTMPSFFVSPKSFNEGRLNLVPHELSVVEGGYITSVVKLITSAKPVEAGSLTQTSQLQASCPLVIPASGSKKGILKRNPRGCRGLCTCLNCASFRLHAERAFEFSKNQMHYAEEVALDLITKLSDLRNMLEKSAFSSNDCGAVSINQVKEACRKACEAEELAKSRLSQMNYDLSIHCRITCGQRPRVRFANNVEERVIP